MILQFLLNQFDLAFTYFLSFIKSLRLYLFKSFIDIHAIFMGRNLFIFIFYNLYKHRITPLHAYNVSHTGKFPLYGAIKNRDEASWLSIFLMTF